jgi:hypothetical protein
MQSLERFSSEFEDSLNYRFSRLLSLVCASIHDFQSYNMKHIAVSIGRSRGQSRYGVWAHVTPLRYVGGNPERKGRRYGWSGAYTYESEHILKAVPDAKYLLTIMVPRFFRLTPRERLETLVHELYHLHPSLRGDLRRFPRPHIHHGPTPAAYRRRVKTLTDQALREFPELIQHPLMTATECPDVRARHFSAPKHVFKPRLPVQTVTTWTERMTKWMGLSGIVLGVLLGSQSFAQLKVEVTQGASLYSEPSQRSEVRGAVRQGEQVQALRTSPKKTWVEIKSASGQGWVPRMWVRPLTENETKSSGKNALPISATDRQARVDEALAAFDSAWDTFSVSNGGTLFEKPSDMADRYGVVEKGDAVEVLDRSASGQWTRIRLQATGEEGWYPSQWIVRNREERVARAPGQNSAQITTGWATRGRRWGLSGGYFRNLTPEGVGARPRDRAEVGLLSSAWLGETLTSGLKKADTNFYGVALLGRYSTFSSDGYLGGVFEGGLSWVNATVNIEGFSSSEIVAQLKESVSGSTWGFHSGILTTYAVTPLWYVELGARAHLGSKSFVHFLVGTSYRF